MADKFAIVTGASTGIGFELASIAAENGYDLLVVADEPLIDAAARDFETHGVTAKSVEADLSTFEGVDRLLAAAAQVGASSILVRCRDADELAAVLKAAEGQLTATIHMDEADTDLAAKLVPVLERKAGRILANGWPTGVEVAHAMVHGGPYPATSDARTTSVGSLAIDRFLRPVSYQNLPAALLPATLRDGGANGAPVLLDGTTTAN